MDVPHGMLPQPWVFRAFRAVTAEVFSLLQKVSHLLYGQFRERYLSQSGEDMVLEEIAVGRIGGRSALVFIMGLLPVEDILCLLYTSDAADD